jgi:hypothetical protein
MHIVASHGVSPMTFGRNCASSSMDANSEREETLMHGSASITKPRRRSRRARRTRGAEAGTATNDALPRAREGVATAPPRPPTGWHGQWSALDDRLYGGDKSASHERRRIRPIHALVGLLLAAFAVACFVIVSRSGDPLQQFDGVPLTPAPSQLDVEPSPGE